MKRWWVILWVLCKPLNPELHVFSVETQGLPGDNQVFNTYFFSRLWTIFCLHVWIRPEPVVQQFHRSRTGNTGKWCKGNCSLPSERLKTTQKHTKLSGNPKYISIQSKAKKCAHLPIRESKDNNLRSPDKVSSYKCAPTVTLSHSGDCTTK